MCDYNSEPASSHELVKKQTNKQTNTEHNASNELPKILINNNKNQYISLTFYP